MVHVQPVPVPVAVVPPAPAVPVMPMVPARPAVVVARVVSGRRLVDVVCGETFRVRGTTEQHEPCGRRRNYPRRGELLEH